MSIEVILNIDSVMCARDMGSTQWKMMYVEAIALVLGRRIRKVSMCKKSLSFCVDMLTTVLCCAVVLTIQEY